jgi:hypothetical protein
MGLIIRLALLFLLVWLVYNFWLEMIIVIFSLVAYFFYTISSIKKSILKLKKEDLEDIEAKAKEMFPFNRFARSLFLSFVKGHQKKQEAKKKEEADGCLEIFGINSMDDIDEAYIKKTWKKLAREYHPDRYQDEAVKEQMHNKISEINDCKDKLLKYYGNK